MLRFIKKRAAVSRSADKSQCEVDHRQQSKGLKNNHHLYQKPEQFSPCPISNGKSFSCEDLLLVGSFSQTKRQQHSTSVHTSPSISDDQISQSLSLSIEANDNDNNNIYATLGSIQHNSDPVVHNHIRKPTLHAKVDFILIYASFIYFCCYRFPENAVIIFVIKMLLDGVSLGKLALCLFLMTLNIRK